MTLYKLELKRQFNYRYRILLLFCTFSLIVIPLLKEKEYYFNRPTPIFSQDSFVLQTKEYQKNLKQFLPEETSSRLIPYYDIVLQTNASGELSVGWNYLIYSGTAFSLVISILSICAVINNYSKVNDNSIDLQLRTCAKFTQLKRTRFFAVLTIITCSYILIKLAQLLVVYILFSFKGANIPIQDYFIDVNPYPWTFLTTYLANTGLDILAIFFMNSILFILSTYIKESTITQIIAYLSFLIFPHICLIPLHSRLDSINPAVLLTHWGVFDTNDFIVINNQVVFISTIVVCITAISTFVCMYITLSGRKGTQYVEA